MIPDPLHPAIVHFPIALAFVAPLVAAFVLWKLRRPESPVRMWLIIPVLLTSIAISSGIATSTGEEEEERVEEVVDHDTIETHEERGNQFFWFSIGMAIVSIAGFAPGRAGRAIRWFTLLLTIVGSILVTRVGHSGGTIVYDHLITTETSNDSGVDSAYASPVGNEDDDGE